MEEQSHGVPFYTPDYIAYQMLSARKVYEGLSPEATLQNRELFKALPSILSDIEIPDTTISIQPVGSRLKGYHGVQSDLDVHIVGDPDGSVRYALDKSIREKFGIYVAHGMDGFIEPDELLTSSISYHHDDFIDNMTKKSSNYSVLFERGGYEAPELLMARVACVAALVSSEYFDDVQTGSIWKNIQDSFCEKFVTSRNATVIQNKIIDKCPVPLIEEGVLDKYPQFVRYARGEYTDYALPYDVSDAEFQENVEQDIRAQITQELLDTRARKFGLGSLSHVLKRFAPIDLSVDDYRYRNSPFFDTYVRIVESKS